MKTRISAIVLVLISLTIEVEAQWYKREYQVDDINKLTREQLETSLQNAKTATALWGIGAAVGGVWYLAARYNWESDSDTTTFWHEISHLILGEQGVNNVNMVLGAGLMTVCVIGGVVQIIKIGTINSTIRQNYPLSGRLIISPEGIYNAGTRSLCPGVRLTLKF